MSNHRRAWQKHLDTRREDLRWMAETGECAIGAAERLGIKRDALEQWCRRHAPELWPILAARDPDDYNRRAERRYWAAS